MSLTGIAALIAAVSFAVIALTAVYVAARLSRALGEGGALVRDTRARMDDLSAGLAELGEQVAALASAGRAAGPEARAGAWTDEREARNEPQARRERAGPERAEGPGESWSLGEGVNKAAAVAYGVRHAVALRNGRRRTLRGEIVDGGRGALSVQGKKGATR